jgi:hypothetical protein
VLFGGSESFCSLYAVTAFAVDNALQTTAALTPIPQSIADMYFVPSVENIIIAIAIVDALALLALRKPP